MTKIIGLTGGIGSGKSVVARYIAEQGIPVYIADDEARKITENPDVVTKIVEHFGIGILDGEKIDRAKLAALVFNDAEKLQKLNRIVHPAVRKHFSEWIKQHQNHKFVVKEAAILFESGSAADCDYIITVTTPLDLRLKRILSRDNTTTELIRKRMASQWTDQQRIEKSDFVVTNIKIEDTLNQINEILKILQEV
ncbi:MAG: dephospho-CoA kinase [Flavobacterium sp.]|nr:dephospho-CoA kinase [Flavobacterium sp.]